jgi:hypothetical protein
MHLTLTRAELTELTGLRQSTRIQEWLIKRGWVFEAPARRGDVPKVARSYFEARMSGQHQASNGRVGPRLSFMTGGPR